MSGRNMRFNMKQSRKLKRVSWAPGSNLCQVKFFLSEDCPSEVGKKSDEFYDFPPGFGGVFQNQRRAEFIDIPQIKWKCPTLFALRGDWNVAAGEESEEKHIQKQRETRAIAANYPRISTISSRSPVSCEMEECYDDSLTPLIPIEEKEESGNDVNLDDAITKLVTSGADLGAACAIATAILKNEKGYLIDLNLLHEIVNDPTVIAKIVDAYKTAATIVDSPKMLVPSTSANMHGANAEHVGSTIPRIVKDANNYYKQLIREHGTDKRDSQICQENFQELKRPCNIEPCKFFGSTRGCRNGSECPYLHGMSIQSNASNEAKSAKILKLIVGPKMM